MSEWADEFDSRKLSFSVAALWSQACVDIFQWHGMQRCWDHIRRKCTDKWTAANCTEVRFSRLNLFFLTSSTKQDMWQESKSYQQVLMSFFWKCWRNRWFSSDLDSRGSSTSDQCLCSPSVFVYFYITTISFFLRYLLQYQEPIPCEQLVTALCDIKQAYTQFGGKELTHPIVLHLETMSQCWWCVMAKYYLQIRW